MKIIKPVLICNLMIIMFISCGYNCKASIKPVALKQYENNISDIGDDTTFLLNINNKTYQLILIHDEQDSNKDELGSNIAVRIVDNSNHDTLYKKIYDYNVVGDLTKSGSNNYYLTLLGSGGGSGYSGTLFKIKITPKVVFQPIVDINELSYWIFNKYDTELLFFKGNWGENESHFEAHRQSVSICKIQENNVIIKKLGITKYKHDFFEEIETLKEFKTKEPVLSKEIKWVDYE